MKWSIRNLFTWVVANLLIMFGFVRRARRKAMKGDYILSMYFHNPSRKEFEACVRWLKKHRFTFLSTKDIYDIVYEGLPVPKGAVLMTVDDGWQSNDRNIVEVANKYQVPVTIFVSTQPVEEGAYWWSYIQKADELNYELPPKARLKRVTNEERLALVNEIKKDIALPREALTVEQVERIARTKYVTIGGHTHTHPILVNCNQDDVYEELKLSKEKLEQWTSKEVFCFAYPNGDYSDREMQLLKELDYKFAFSSDPEYLTEDKLKHYYNLPRFGLLEGVSLAENICRMVGVWKPLMLKFRIPFLGSKKFDTEQPIFSSKRARMVVIQ